MGAEAYYEGFYTKEAKRLAEQLGPGWTGKAVNWLAGEWGIDLTHPTGIVAKLKSSLDYSKIDYPVRCSNNCEGSIHACEKRQDDLRKSKGRDITIVEEEQQEPPWKND